MSKNLTKYIYQADIDVFSKYPIYNGQKFYTDEGNYYEDIGGYRCAILTTKAIQSGSTLTATSTKLANTFVILYNTTDSTYGIYKYDAAGAPHEISSGTGVSEIPLPSGATQYDLLEYNGSDWLPVETIRVNKIENRVDADSTSYIQFFDPEETNNYEIKINGKTEISNLDFGEW